MASPRIAWYARWNWAVPSTRCTVCGPGSALAHGGDDSKARIHRHAEAARGRAARCRGACAAAPATSTSTRSGCASTARATVNVTGRPALWTAFKSLPLDPHGRPGRRSGEAARELFERSGLEVQARHAHDHAGGQRYLFVSADFADVNRISCIAGVPGPANRRAPRGRSACSLDGSWQRPLDAARGRRARPRGR